MRGLQRRSVTSAPHSTLFVSVGCAALVLFLSSCSDNFSVVRDDQQTNVSLPPVSYSIICINHGDGDYLYHDASGKEHKADEEALEGLTLAALQNPQAEVFIFHQRPKYRFLFFFPLPDGEFFYYRNGRLAARESYWRDNEQSRFEPEVELYHRFHAESQRAVVKIFLYSGHEIPEFGGTGYDASAPDRRFTVHDLQTGLQGFTGSSAKFDLLVLSACFGGTPYTVGALGSFTRYIIASPDNLHLSYFDFRALNRLDRSLRADSVSAFAQRFARKSFDRLAGSVQTSVTVAVYDVDSTERFIDSVRSAYNKALNALSGETQSLALMTEHCDCADLPEYVLPRMSDGLNVLYRPARFGRSRAKQNHSGWECWKIIEPLPESTQDSAPSTR